MPLITWNESYSVKVKSMDAQHKRWIDLINELYEAMRVGKGKDILSDTLTKMLEYGRTHFAAEELLMDKNGYPELKQHQKQHDAFFEQMDELSRRQMAGEVALTIEVMGSLKDWLVNHIQGVDQRYSDFLNSKGIY